MAMKYLSGQSDKHIPTPMCAIWVIRPTQREVNTGYNHTAVWLWVSDHLSLSLQSSQGTNRALLTEQLPEKEV